MMNHRVTVEVGGATASSTGAPVKTWRTVGERVPCYLRQLNGSESIRWGRETTRNALVGVFRSDVFLVDQTYRIKWTPNGWVEARTFDVQSQALRGFDETGEADYIELLLEETT